CPTISNAPRASINSRHPTAKRKQKKKHGDSKWSDMKSSTPCHYVLQVPTPSSQSI
ncbi:unnamed protein product, partial [Ectocarpus sp. 6 AP-2014]